MDCNGCLLRSAFVCWFVCVRATSSGMFRCEVASGPNFELHSDKVHFVFEFLVLFSRTYTRVTVAQSKLATLRKALYLCIVA
jgi:hypothetical protein